MAPIRLEAGCDLRRFYLPGAIAIQLRRFREIVRVNSTLSDNPQIRFNPLRILNGK